MIRRRATWWVAFVAIALTAGMLGLYRTAAAQKEEREPFANAVAQRAEMIALLKDIQAQIKEQNQLLGSGKLTVIVQSEKKEE